MATVTEHEPILDSIPGWLTPDVAQRIVDSRPDPKLQERILELGRKANEGELSSEEDAEYRRYVVEGDLLTLLRLKARRVLTQDAS
jgi:hypothetical protein